MALRPSWLNTMAIWGDRGQRLSVYSPTPQHGRVISPGHPLVPCGLSLWHEVQGLECKNTCGSICVWCEAGKSCIHEAYRVEPSRLCAAQPESFLHSTVPGTWTLGPVLLNSRTPCKSLRKTQEGGRHRAMAQELEALGQSRYGCHLHKAPPRRHITIPCLQVRRLRESHVLCT